MNANDYHHREPRLSGGGLAIVIGIHILIFWLLLRANVISIPLSMPVLSASIITPPAPQTQPEPKVVPPPPKPVEQRPRPEPVQIAAPSPAPAAIAIPTPEPPPPAPAAPVAAPAAPQATQPRFDADYLNNPRPSYPRLSRRLGEQGKVILRVHVLANGLPDEVLVQTSSGTPRLDQSALETVRRWKFVPARQSGADIAAWVLVPIAFSLTE